jgi:hypothetical protein
MNVQKIFLTFLMKVVIEIVVNQDKNMTIQIILEYLSANVMIYGIIKLEMKI